MNKKIFLLVIQLFYGLSLIAQEQIIIPKWKIGDHLSIEEKGTVTTSMFGMEIPIEVNSKLKIRVLEKTSEGYIIEVYDANLFNLTGGGLMAPMIEQVSSNMKDVLKKLEDLRLKVQISKQGEIKDLKNWEEVQTLLLETNDKMMISLSKKFPIPAEKMDSLKTVAKAKLDTKEKVMQVTLENLEYLLSGYSVPYSIKGTKMVSALIYSKMNYFELNHTGILANLKTKTTSKSETKTIVSYDVIFDKDELIKHIIEHSDESQEMDDELLRKLKMTEDRNFVFDIATSWPKMIKINSALIIEGILDMKITSEYQITKIK